MPKIIQMPDGEAYLFDSIEEFNSFYAGEFLSRFKSRAGKVEGHELNLSNEKILEKYKKIYDEYVEYAREYFPRHGPHRGEIRIDKKSFDLTIENAVLFSGNEYEREIKSLKQQAHKVERHARPDAQSSRDTAQRSFSEEKAVPERTGKKIACLSGLVLGAGFFVHGAYVAGLTVKQGRQDDKPIDWRKVAFHTGEAILGAAITFASGIQLNNLGHCRA